MQRSATVNPREVEAAFQVWVERGLLNEDWASWSQLYTDDAVYTDQYWGIFRGPEEIRVWNEIVCAASPQAYEILISYAIDGPRVIARGQITADNPEPGGAPFTQPIFHYLEYAGNGKWRREEDMWHVDAARLIARQYDEARHKFDVDHPARLTRLEWQNTPVEWARPEPSFQVKPSWVGKDDIVPQSKRRDLAVGERVPW